MEFPGLQENKEQYDTSKDPEASELWNVPSICIKTTFF
jgi:hypothetical protein